MPNFRTDGDWGAGLGRRLTKEEADANIWEHEQAITALQSDRPEPNSIASISLDGNALTFHMSDSTEIGPLAIDVPTIKWRGAWTPFTLYGLLDTFIVEGTGIYSVLAAHTSGASFDPAIEVAGDPALQKIWGFEQSDVGIVYDVEFQYQGVLADALRPPVNFLALRPFTLPSSANGEHLAYIETPAASVRQVLPILHDAVTLGTVTFEVGDNNGAVVIADGADFAFGDHLIIGQPGGADATAAGFTIALALRRIVL